MRHLKESKNFSTAISENSYLETIHYTEALQDYLNKPIHTFFFFLQD